LEAPTREPGLPRSLGVPMPILLMYLFGGLN
jgi:hypothetical protein